MPYDPPSADDPAVDLGLGELTMAELFEQATAIGPGTTHHHRVPCRMHPELLLSPLLGEGMTVWSTDGDAEEWADAMRAERVTAEVRGEATGQSV